ncbi:MAG: NAD-dependent epimerase/dehydratase family protein [Sciscionella sp.]
MRIFLAGASGVIGVRLVPLFVEAGHDVAAMTRSPETVGTLEELGATPVVCDVFDASGVRRAVIDFGADAIVNELTDLPDDPAELARGTAMNARIRREGGGNLLAAAHALGGIRYITQSVAWELPGDGGAAVADLERATLAAGGVVLRYGQFYGPGTYWETELPPVPRVHIDEAARQTVPALDAVSGVILIAEE